MSRQGWWWWLCATGVAGMSCEREVAVGHEYPATIVGAGGSGAAAGSAGAGVSMPGGQAQGGLGAAGEGGAGEGAAGAGGDSTSSPSWRADHETASFAQWLGDENGIANEERSGRLELTTERAHSGTYAFTATITTDDGELHQAMIGRKLTLAEGRYGAWYFLPEKPKAANWVLMKLSNGAEIDRFDIDIEVQESGEPRLRLYEHGEGWISAPSALTFPVGRWVHIEALYRSTPAADGRLVVLQDEEAVLDTGPRATASDARVAFFCGSASYSVEPMPYRLFIDDASIDAEAVPK